MTPSAQRFQQHCVEGIRTFVQTAIVIDNEATLDPAPVANEQLKTATAPVTSVIAEEHSPLSAVASPSAEAAGEENSENIMNGNASHGLNAKALTDAFHRLEVVCGLYKPEPGEDAIGLATKAAQHADIVVVDWHLESTANSAKAKDIIREIVRQDTSQFGRLRLIAVYTGAPGLPGIAKEVFDYLEDDPTVKGQFTLSGGALTRGDSRICFYNKRDTPGVLQKDVVTEAHLPDRLMTEFARVSEGILATFAVTAVAAIRRAAHHVVALFQKELDGSFVAHRCRMVDPESANDFAIELITGEIRNVIAMAEVPERSLSANVLSDWVDHIAINNGHKFKDFGQQNRELDSGKIKGLITRGCDALGDLALAKNSKYLEGLFFSSTDETKARSLEFSRLTTLKREGEGRTGFADSWRPVLTLGTVVKVCRPATGIAAESCGAAEPVMQEHYLVCVQPRCHSVRLKAAIAFPFQKADVAALQEVFNLVIRDGSKSVRLAVKWRPQDAELIRFAPDAQSHTVKALKPETQFEFIDVNGNEFIWIADINDMIVQRDASELAKYIHTPGVDIFEWLRLAAHQGKIDLP